ncbi:MAG: hypothetical protein ABR978_04740 [Dehalococcoidia bacterium]|jgi:hypothetical protein
MTNTTTRIHAATVDSGRLREYLAKTYAGRYFFGDGLPGYVYEVFIRQVKTLAKLVGKSQTQVLADMLTDAGNLE